MNCVHCGKAAFTHCVKPPLCEQHYDLAILAGHLARTGQPVTVENVQAALAEVQVRSGVLSITAADVERLWYNDTQNEPL